MRRALFLALLGTTSCALVLDYGDYGDTGAGAAAGGAGAGDTGGTGGTGGAGAGGPCSLGDVVECYSGPPGTAGKGTCRQGSRTCDAQGVLGPCEGEVVPSFEVALNTTDEDCDGSAGGEALWKARLGDGEAQSATDVILDSTGSILLAGWYHGTLDIGGGEMIGPPPAPGPGMFVAALSASGGPLWVRDGGGPAPRSARGIAVDSTGDVIAVGSSGDAAGSDGLVVQLGPDGSPGWSHTLDATSAAAALGVAVGQADTVHAIARYRGTITLPDGVHASVGSDGKDDVLIVKYDAGGAVLWSRSFGGDRDDVPRGVAVSPDGEVLVTGEYRGKPEGMPDAGDNDIPGFSALFVMSVTSAGIPKWTKGFPAEVLVTGNTRGAAITADGKGAVWVTGAMFGDTSFGQGGLLYSGGSDLLVAKLDGASGEPIWARSFGDGLDQQGTSIAAAEDGSVFVAGTFSGVLDFDAAVTGDELTAQSGQDMFVVKLHPDGKPLWSARFAAGEPDEPRDVRLAVHGGHVVLAGGWAGLLDFGSGGTLAPIGGLDLFVAKLTQ